MDPNNSLSKTAAFRQLGPAIAAVALKDTISMTGNVHVTTQSPTSSASALAALYPGRTAAELEAAEAMILLRDQGTTRGTTSATPATPPHLPIVMVDDVFPASFPGRRNCTRKGRRSFRPQRTPCNRVRNIRVFLVYPWVRRIRFGARQWECSSNQKGRREG